MNAADASPDASWVSVETPLDIDAMRDFCGDLERLYRINPYLEIQTWQPIAAGGFRVAWRNLSNNQSAALELRLESESQDAFLIRYSQGIKGHTRFTLQARDSGSLLVIRDDYSGLPQAERASRVAEADRSLPAWGWALHGYLRNQVRWGGIPLWRWYMRRIWLPLRPGARRIMNLIVWATIAEFLLFLFVMLIYWIEFT